MQWCIDFILVTRHQSAEKVSALKIITVCFNVLKFKIDSLAKPARTPGKDLPFQNHSQINLWLMWRSQELVAGRSAPLSEEVYVKN